MLLCFLAPVFFLQASLSPTTQVNTAPVDSDSTVFSSYNSRQDQFLLTWWGDDIVSSYIYGAVYNANGALAVSTLDLFGNGYNPVSDIASCYNSHANQYFLSWSEYNVSPSPGPAFAILAADGSVVEGVTPISTLAPGGDVLSCYNSLTHQYFVTWGTGSGPTYPLYFAILNEDGTIFKSATGIPPISGGESNNPNLFCSYNPKTNEYLVSWSGDDFTVYIAIYDASGTAVKTATAISPAGQGYTAVSSCVNSSNNQYLLSWIDTGSNSYFLILSKDGDPLYGPTVIPGFLGKINYPLCCSYNSGSDSYVLTSVTNANQSQFAVLSSRGAVIVEPTLIGNPSGLTTLNNAYNSSGARTWITWSATDSSTVRNGYFAIYSPLVPIQSIPTSTCFPPVQPNRPTKTLF